MKNFSVRRLSIVSMAIGVITASSSSASAQILDRVLGRDSRTRVEERPVERSYSTPGQDDRGEFRDREGRVYREGTEIRSGTQYRGEAEFRGGERTQTRTASSARRGTTLIGSTVRLDGGQTLGRIDDIVIGESGCVDFMVVSVSGLRGLSGRLAVLPFAIGEADFSRRIVYVDWAEDDLRRAPIFFSSSRWPDFTDTAWSGEVFAYFELDSHDTHRGRAYREPRESDRGRFDERSSRDRDSDRDNDRSTRGQDSRTRDRSERSTRDRDSYDRDEGRSRSDSRSRSRETREGEDEPQSQRSSRTRESDTDFSDRSKTNESEGEEDRKSDSNRRSNKSDLPD